MTTTLENPDTKPRATTVSLVLGSGGARGYAHIGVIDELLARGYEIRSIAGSSMGALVGGIYAIGQLSAYREWVCGLSRYDVWRLVDLGIGGGGFIKGERIMAELRSLVGDDDIRSLPIRYTAVAVDLDASREIWFTEGPLFEAIRASIAIPGVFRPVNFRGHRLVDGGLLNPVPVAPTLGDNTDCTIAVDVNAPIPYGDHDPARRLSTPVGVIETADAGEIGNGLRAWYRRRIAGLFRRSRVRGAYEPGAIELFARSLDTVQATLTRFKLAAQPPDLLIQVPREACSFYAFDCAQRMIELGRERARATLADWRPPPPRHD